MSSSFYIPSAFGLRKLPNGDWVFRRSYFYPAIPFFKGYRLSPKVGGRLNEIIYRKIYWSKLSAAIAIFAFIWFEAGRNTSSSEVWEFIRQHRYHACLASLGFIWIINNCKLARIARFCKKIGTPC